MSFGVYAKANAIHRFFMNADFRKGTWRRLTFSMESTEMPTSSKDEKKKELKQDEKAHEAQAKADRLQRHALDNGKVKKAEKAQQKADREAAKAARNHDED